MKVPRGALLNFATVGIGGLLGLAVGTRVPESYRDLALSGLGLVTVGIGIKMFLATRSVIVVAAAIALGGIIGASIGISHQLEGLAEWLRASIGGGEPEQFNGAFIATSVLFLVGPMTLLGCLQDAVENKIELIAIKSTMDGVAGFFFAATSHSAALGVLATGFALLLVQGTLTLAGRLLKPLVEDRELLDDLTGTGGIILVGVGLGLLELKELPVADFLPALVAAPLLLAATRRLGVRRA